MRIRSISATGFKNLTLTNLSFKEVTFVFGENGIGKSNLLQLIHSLFRQKEAPIESGGLEFEIEGRLDDEDLICRKESSGTASVVLTTALPKFQEMCRALGPKLVKPGAAEATLGFRFWRQNGTSFKLTSIKVADTEIFAEGTPGTKIPEGALQAVHTWLSEEILGCTVYIPTNRLHQRSLASYTAEPSVDAVSNLENVILRLWADPRENQELIESIRKSMAEFFGVEDIRSTLVTRPEPSTEPRKAREHDFREELGPPLSDVGVGVRLRERDKQWFTIEQVGSGLQQMLVILTTLYRHKARIALVEEFDSSLSDKLRSELLKHFIAITGHSDAISQLITTTHGSFDWPVPRPLAITAKTVSDGRVTFEQATDDYLRRHTLPAVIA
jgi:energy-coupling factor transporter ATP-binding protein EcfA2